VTVLTDLRYSARSLTRTPGLAAALLLTIAFGIGSNAVVHGFVRGLLTRDLPVPNSDAVVSVVAGAADGAGPVSYDDYLSIKTYSEVFEWVGAARESHGTIVVDGRSWMVRLATVTPELGVLFQLSLDERVVLSHRMRQHELRLSADRHADTIRIDGVDARMGSVAPEWLEGLYLGRPVDIWVPWAKATIQDIDRSSRTLWVIARLRAGISIDRAETLINSGPGGAVSVRIFPYSGITPDLTHGLSRIGTLLLAAAAGVFLIACANVACLLLARASARSQETAVRVALGASRTQLARQLLSDSVLISVAGGALGMLLAMWTTNVVPLLFFDKDAVQLVFAPDLVGISAVSAACVSITIACGLVPLFEIRDDRPAAVLQRENAGPSTSMRRLRMALVVGQMALCCALVIATGLLLESFRSALQTNASHPLRGAILATVESRPRSTPSETASSGMAFFRAIEDAGRSVRGVTPRAWIATLPGGLPAWQQFRVESADLPITEESMDVALFTPASLSHIRVPAIAGRLFGGQDTPQACRAAIVNEAAARDVFGGDAVGRLITDPSGQRLEIVGVVASRQAEGANDTIRPTIYYYANQTGIPVAIPGTASFRLRARLNPSNAALDSNVVSAGYFSAMGWTLEDGRLFADDLADGCRVGVVNQEAAERYFGGNAVGAAVIDQAGRRTEIVGVVRSRPLRTLQRAIEPSIYFPMAQDFLRGMTLILAAREVGGPLLADLDRRLESVPGRGPAPVAVRTLESHLSKTALAPSRIATTLVGASAATAVALGVLGLYGAMTDSVRRRRREIGVRIALGAPAWYVIRQVVSEGARLAAAGTVVGMLASIMVARWLARLTPHHEPVALWVWVAAPLVLMAAVVVASALPARRALTVDPITITRADN
jgi:predicted permease